MNKNDIRTLIVIVIFSTAVITFLVIYLPTLNSTEVEYQQVNVSSPVSEEKVITETGVVYCDGKPYSKCPFGTFQCTEDGIAKCLISRDAGTTTGDLDQARHELQETASQIIEEVNELKAEKQTEIDEVNSNPWMSEYLRVAKLRAIQAKYESLYANYPRALCVDFTFSGSSSNNPGTCSGHGGVHVWLY